MTESEIEPFLQKAFMLYLNPGSYSRLDSDLPGTISLAFKDEDADDCLAFWKYCRNNFQESTLAISILQTAPDKIDFWLLVDTPQALAINVRNIKCDSERTAYFFKRQRIDKPLLLSFRIRNKIRTVEDIVASKGAELQAELNKSITIHSWKGTPFRSTN